MPDAIVNTSPVLYLRRIDALDWLPAMFGEVWMPSAVVREPDEGRRRGFSVPDPRACPWLQVMDARSTPFEWLSLDLGPGELAAMALALENPTRTLLLDDALARRTAQLAGLRVWGTLRILPEAKARGLVPAVGPTLRRLQDSGLWVTKDVLVRVLSVAGERV